MWVLFDFRQQLRNPHRHPFSGRPVSETIPLVSKRNFLFLQRTLLGTGFGQTPQNFGRPFASQGTAFSGSGSSQTPFATNFATTSTPFAPSAGFGKTAPTFGTGTNTGFGSSPATGNAWSTPTSSPPVGFGVQTSTSTFGIQPQNTNAFGTPQNQPVGFGTPQSQPVGFGTTSTQQTGFGTTPIQSTGFGTTSTQQTGFGMDFQTSQGGFGNLSGSSATPQTSTPGFSLTPNSGGFGTGQQNPTANVFTGSFFQNLSSPLSGASGSTAFFQQPSSTPMFSANSGGGVPFGQTSAPPVNPSSQSSFTLRSSSPLFTGNSLTSSAPPASSAMHTFPIASGSFQWPSPSNPQQTSFSVMTGSFPNPHPTLNPPSGITPSVSEAASTPIPTISQTQPLPASTPPISQPRNFEIRPDPAVTPTTAFPATSVPLTTTTTIPTSPAASMPSNTTVSTSLPATTMAATSQAITSQAVSQAGPGVSDVYGGTMRNMTIGAILHESMPIARAMEEDFVFLAGNLKGFCLSFDLV